MMLALQPAARSTRTLRCAVRLVFNHAAFCYWQVSHTFCRDFISLLLRDGDSGQFGGTDVLVQGLRRVSNFAVSV